MLLRSALTLTACFVSSVLVFDQPNEACTKRGFVAVREEKVAYFVGHATADSVFAGPGVVRYVVAPGHSGPAGDRSVFGQVVAVEKIAGATKVGRSARSVVMVPWDYGADCAPTPWMQSVIWQQPGTRGLYSAVLRDSAHWAGGIPTFDVYSPEFQPYRGDANRPMPSRSGPRDASLSVDELFPLVDLFPDARLLRDSAEAAVAPLFAWAREQRALARRYPMSEAMAHARSAVEYYRLRKLKPAIVGTYELSVSLNGTPARTFYARTRGVPTTTLEGVGMLRPDEDPTFIPAPTGYSILTEAATSLEALTSDCERARRMEHEGYMSVLRDTTVRIAGTMEWIGQIEVSLVTRAFPEDAALKQFASDEQERSYQRYRAGLGSDTPARYTLTVDGGMHVEQVITLEDRRRLTIRGRRVSTVSIACPW